MKLVGIREASSLLRSGSVVAAPAEACLGLSCNPFDQRAVSRVRRLKRRSSDMGLILVAAHINQLLPFLAHEAKTLLDQPLAGWPGPNTWIFPASRRTPYWIKGPRSTVAVRITALPSLRNLCTRFGDGRFNSPELRVFVSITRNKTKVLYGFCSIRRKRRRR